MKALLTALLLLVAALPALAIGPEELMDDPQLEARARTIYKDLRCVVCQNESIDSSAAGIAADMRRIVRERLEAGDSNQQIMDFMVARYGDYVLLDPPFKGSTLLLWFGPLAVLVIASTGIALAVARRRRASAGTSAATPLSADEQARLKRLLEDDPS